MPSLLTNSELTALLNEDAAARAEARTLANIARRASTLFQDGYSARPVGHGWFCVFSPEDNTYAVFVSETPDCEVFGSSCSCPCFAARKTCKHLQAVVNAIEEGAEGDARRGGPQALPTFPQGDKTMTSIGDILTSIFRPVPCDFCPSIGPTYRDPETGCLYCLPCLEMATDPALALEDGPEDAETVAIGRAVLDELFDEMFPLSASQEEIRAERRDMALIACHSRQIAA